MTDTQRCEPPNLVVEGCTVHNTVTLDLALVRALVEVLERIAAHPEAGIVLTDYDDTGKQRVWPTVEYIARTALARAKEAGL